MAEAVSLLNKDYLYELLGCDELSTEEQISTEYKIKAKSLHPDKNFGNDEITAEFIALKKAKEILCNKEERKKYDFWRRSGLAIPFDVWLKTNNSNLMSFHWAPKPKKEKMIESCHNFEESDNRKDNTGLETPTTRSRTSDLGWERKSSLGDSRLNQFRNYMI